MKNYIRSLLILLFSIFVFGCNNQHFIKSGKYRSQIKERLAEQKLIAKNRDKQLFDVFNQQLTTGERESLEFLFAFMPLSDLADYNGDFYLSNVRTTLKAREELSWTKTIPEEVFLNFVLPLRVNNENLDSFRIKLYDELKSRVKNLTMLNAALEVNHWCHEKVTYRGSDERTSSPLSTIKTSWGRCGEESVLAVNAFRTVGIPARQVYTPRWAHTDDNHAWVEVWIDGKWNYLGACEPEAVLNKAWFTEPARRAMFMNTRAYGCYFGTEQVIYQNKYFSELNLITNYAPAKNVTVKVIDDKKQPVENALVEYRLYNYCEFYPVAHTTTNTNGFTNFTGGLGDIIVWASKNDSYGFQKISVAKTDTIVVEISKDFKRTENLDFDLIPPIQPKPYENIDVDAKLNQCRFTTEDSTRNVYFKTFKDSTWATKFADELNLNADSVRNIFKKTYGNSAEISTFLRQPNAFFKHRALSLLYNLTDKDIRDSKAIVLNDHLKQTSSPNFAFQKMDAEFFSKYILSPRIGNELINSWRFFILRNFKPDFISIAQHDVNTLINWIKLNISVNDTANLLSRCPISPQGVFELKCADRTSRNIFFVAVCRTFRIPARLNPINGTPQYYSQNNWVDAVFEKQVASPKGFIQFVNQTKDFDPKYYVNFTVAKLNNGIYQTLELDEMKPLSKFENKILVDAGKYMLVTGNRLQGGAVLANVSFFDVKENELNTVNVKVRSIKTKSEVIGKFDAKGLQMQSFTDYINIKFDEAVSKKPFVVIWIDANAEPSKHILAELPEFTDKLNKWNGKLFFVVSKNTTIENIKQINLKKLPATSLFLKDETDKAIAQIEKIKNRKLQKLYPVIVVCDVQQNIIFYSEGYTIGIGEQLTSVLGL